MPARGQWDESALRRWLDARLEEAEGFAGLPGLRFDCVVRIPPPVELSAAEIAAIEAEVAGKPDHPKRSLLESHREGQKAAGAGAKTTIWLHSDAVWRWNREVQAGEYFDTGRLDDDQWRLAPTQIAIHSVSAPALRAGEGTLEGVRAGAEWLVRVILHAGFGGRGTPPYTVQSVSVDATTWTADLRAEPGIATWVVGGFESGEPVIRRVEYRASPLPQWVGGRAEFGGWRYDEAVKRVIPSWAAQYFGGGKLFRRVDEVRFAAVDPAQVRALCAVPSVVKGDMLRGALDRVRAVNDWRPGRMGKDLLASGQVQERVPLPDPRAPETAWRWIGWTVGGGLLLGVIVRRIVLRAGA